MPRSRRKRLNIGEFVITFEGCVTEKRFRGLAKPEIYRSLEACLERLIALFINFDAESGGYSEVPCPEHDRIVIWKFTAASGRPDWVAVWAFVGTDLPDAGLRRLGDELPGYGSLHQHACKHW